MVAILFSIGGVILVGKSNLGRDSMATRVWYPTEPYSADPMEYDSFVHHVVIRPVLASLVTQYRSGTIMGVIADSWSSDEKLSTWRFSIRPGLTFSNGDPITPEIVAASLTRVARLQHASGSKSGLTEHFVGIEALDRGSREIPGIRVSGRDVILAFRDPQPKLLETISFGLYAIVHPADYDGETGKWLAPRSAIASGAYTIARWDNSEVELRLRADFPIELRHPSAPAVYVMGWQKDKRDSADLALGNDLDAANYSGKKLHTGGAIGLGIYYIHAFSWKLPSSPFNNTTIRACVRNQFYADLERSGVEVVKSFLPISIPGIKAFESSPSSGTGKSFSVRVRLGSSSPFAAKVYSALASAVKACGGNVEEAGYLDSQNFVRHLDPDQESYDSDIDAAMTGILLEDPVADVKFMIQSKEGIRLPDPTGVLAAEASKAMPDLSVINRVIWDDAVVWPVTTYLRGIWATEGAFDFSLINLNLPPTDLSWIGRL
jgi:hypothetical protein